MSQRDIFIIPVAQPRQHAGAQAAPTPRAGILRLGILDNGKSNADHLLRMLVESVRADVQVSSVFEMRKASAAAGADPETLDRLGAEADFVLSAMAD